jgi:hypothetical protein
MRTTTTLTASALVAAGGALLGAIAATPAAARPDPAQWPVVHVDDGQCPLERIGTQFVRCDALTGAGVPAPSYIPEQG